MRPIDADALISDIEDARKMVFHSPYERRFHEDRIEFALGMVEDMPILDYAPVKHGEWAVNTDGYFSDEIICSKCKAKYNFIRIPNYCPNCGALMDWKEDGKE